MDLVAMGGTVRLVLSENKSFKLTITEPGEPVQEMVGTWAAVADELTLSYTIGSNAGAMQFAMTMSGATLGLAGADTDYDFDDDGVSEPAKVNLTMVKQP
ncbi:MAG TPA: hypothetical protein VIR81_05930 [Myxococcales bacterium]